VSHSFKGVATLLGFVLGVASVGVAITAATISLIVTADKISQLENMYPSLSSAISLTLAFATLTTSFFLMRGSLWIWRFSVYGGALNLALGLVLVTVSYGIYSLLTGYITSDALKNFLLASYIIASIGATVSGILGSAAHHGQITRRFAQTSMSNTFRVSVHTNRGKHDVDVTGESTGQYVKERVCEMEGASKDDARLLFRGKIVKDDVLLKELGVSEGDTFTLVTP